MLIDTLESRRLFTAGQLDPYFGNAGTIEGGQRVLSARDGSIYTLSRTSTAYRDDLRVTGPNGHVKYARFDSIINSSNDNGLVVARHKLSPPGASWAGRNGTYSVRLVGTQVSDSDGHATSARSLGAFMVNVGGARALSAPPSFASSVNRMEDLHPRDRDLVDHLHGVL